MTREFLEKRAGCMKHDREEGLQLSLQRSAPPTQLKECCRTLGVRADAPRARTVISELVTQP